MPCNPTKTRIRKRTRAKKAYGRYAALSVCMIVPDSSSQS